MIEAFQNINKAFESKVRLGIMAVLMVNEEADFNFSGKNSFPDRWQSGKSYPCTGRAEPYIECIKGFVGRKPRTSFPSYKIRQRDAF